MKNIKFILWLTLSLVTGLTIGYVLFYSDPGKNIPLKAENLESRTYTCSMHPQIKQNEPGQCPICGMDLVPLSSSMQNKNSSDPFISSMTEEAIALNNIQTTKTGKKTAVSKVFLTGKIKIDEKRLEIISSDFSGRVEKLFINFTGQKVEKGDKLAQIYSPELVVSQKELLLTGKNRNEQPLLYEAAREKLKLLNLNDTQIDEIESQEKIITRFDIISDVSGVVIKRQVSKGDYINKGSTLFEIADLDSLWLILDAYENDLRWIKKGNKIIFTVQAFPEKEFSAKVDFIDPVVDPETRTLKVRANILNENNILKPEMFANAKIISKKHRKKGYMVIPKSSVLWTGKRSVVYVRIPDAETPSFEMREVTLGNRIGNDYIVSKGLEENEDVVTNGVFAIDSAAQLSGRYSMMNRPPAARISVEFREQVTKLVSLYFELTAHFVNSDPLKSQRSAKKMISTLKTIDMKLLTKKEDHQKWMKQIKIISTALNSLRSTKNLEIQRAQFSIISNSIIEISEYFGLTIREVFVQFCPMAFDNKGAYWLSAKKEILNPYFGDKMLNCGEIRKTLRPSNTKANSKFSTKKHTEHHHNH